MRFVLRLGVLALVSVRLALAAEIPRPEMPKPDIPPPSLPPMAPPALSVPAPVPAQVTVADFVKKAQFELAKISPNGDYLAVTVPRGASTAMTVIDLKNMKVTAGMGFPDGEHVWNFYWAGPERVVVESANRGGPLDQPRLTGELYGINVDGTLKKYLYGPRGGQQIGSTFAKVTAYGWAFVMDPLPRDPKHAVVRIEDYAKSNDMRDVKVSLMDVYDGTLHDLGVVPGREPFDVVADPDGKLRYAVSTDDKDNAQVLQAVDSKAGWKRIDPPGGAARWASLYPLSPDGTAFVYSEDASHKVCMRSYSPAAGYKDIACTDKATVGDPIFSLNGGKVIGLANGGGPPDTTWLDNEDPDARFLQALQRSFAGQRLSVTSKTVDNTKFVLLVESGHNPGDFYLVDRATKKAQYLISRRRWIDPAAMTPVQEISYKARDGAQIQGYLTSRAPPGAKPPMVLLVHGGPHGVHDTWSWDPEAQLLASRGFAVLQVNYRGSGGYGDAFEEAGHRKWGTLMQDDLIDAVHWAIDGGMADKDRVCIMGASYGGYAAIMNPERAPGLYRCAVAFAGIYDLASWSSDFDNADTRIGGRYVEKVLGDKAMMLEQSPVTHVDQLKLPLLIAHGTADSRVPFSQAKELRAALDKAHKPYEWVEYPDEEHGLYKEEDEIDFLTRVLAFLDKNIGPGASPAPKP